MGFREILKDVVEAVPGSYAGTLVAKDNMPVDKYVREGADCDVETVCVEYGKIFDEIKQASQVLSLGSVEDVTITSHGTKVLLQLVTDEYFLALILMPTCNAGKARYYLKRAAGRAGRELAI